MERNVAGQVGRVLLLLGPPFVVALAEAVHPTWSSGTEYQAVGPVVGRWLLVHVVLLAGFALTALGLVSLLGGRTDGAARAARVLLGVFVVSNTGFIAVEGLATGLLIASARTLPAAEQAGVEQAVQAIWGQPITMTFAVIASASFMTGILATAVALYPRSQAHLPLIGMALTILAWLPSAVAAQLHDGGLVDPSVAIAWSIGSVTVAYVIGLITALYLIYTSGRAYAPFAFLVIGAVTTQHTPPTGPTGLLALVVGLALCEIIEARSATGEVPQPSSALRPSF